MNRSVVQADVFAPPMVSEVWISGLDTGPLDHQRENRSPTEDRWRVQPTYPVSLEPTDEDG